jgi:hypothetical protein
MKLTIAVLGITVVANVYAVAIDCPKVWGLHVSARSKNHLQTYWKVKSYRGGSRGIIDDVEVGGGRRVDVAGGRVSRSMLDGPLSTLSNNTSLKR